jgi:predicted TIM-barrel fold metal-dependent hydrolase
MQSIIIDAHHHIWRLVATPWLQGPMVPRIFGPNLRRQRIWVPELKKFVRIRVTARGLKTINKQGAYKALKKVGAI